MSIEVTVRHMHANNHIQEYARRKAAAVLDAFPMVEHVHVILGVEKHRQIAEVVVQGKKHLRAEAEEASDKMITSIDCAIEKIERQLSRLRDKIHDHKPTMKPQAVSLEDLSE